MTPTVDDFQALARSSPWLWMSLHFVHRSTFPGDCEAWVRRPGELLVRLPDGSERRESGLPYSTFTLTARSGTGEAVVRPGPVLPHEVTPELRPDGLVAVRPSSWDVNYDDPMHGNYSWVAMLDPVELSHHVDVADLRTDEVAGRPVWRASLRALLGYDPRCGGNCCELLLSEAGRVCELDDPEAAWGTGDRVYPDHYDVALDVQTGIVVRCLPVGGPPDAPWLENDILEVG